MDARCRRGPASAPARAHTRVPRTAPEPGSGSRALRAFHSKTNASSAQTSAAAPPASSSLPAWADAPLGAASSAVRADPGELAAALAANRALQNSLKDTIRDVETALAANAETRRELGVAIRDAREESRASRKSTGGGEGSRARSGTGATTRTSRRFVRGGISERRARRERRANARSSTGTRRDRCGGVCARERRFIFAR